MTVTVDVRSPRVGRVVRVAVWAAAATLLFGACGADERAGSPSRPSTPPAAASTPTEQVEPTGAPTTTAPHGAAPALSEPPALPEQPALADLNVVAGLGYPRDLLDRGRVNIRIDRPDDVELVLLDKQLVARHFTPAPPEERRTVIPPNGQVVAVQALFGDVADCADPAPVEAELAVSYTLGDDPAVRRTSLAVDDATTLDDIRLQVCTQRRVNDDNEFELQVDAVDGETMTGRLVVRRRTGTDRLAFDAIKGTVLFGADAAVPAGSPERVLDADERETSIPITFNVNRCDPHAVGETTRKYGLDVYVAVGDVAAQRIDVPIDALVPRLDEMLARCKQRTGQ